MLQFRHLQVHSETSCPSTIALCHFCSHRYSSEPLASSNTACICFFFTIVVFMLSTTAQGCSAHSQPHNTLGSINLDLPRRWLVQVDTSTPGCLDARATSATENAGNDCGHVQRCCSLRFPTSSLVHSYLYKHECWTFPFLSFPNSVCLSLLAHECLCLWMSCWFGG